VGGGGAVYIINGIKDENRVHLYSGCSVLGFDTVQCWRLTTTFRTNMISPSLRLKELG
jgi:hypothetical protein